MKKLTTLIVPAITLLLTSCLEMGDSTTINNDGSGMFVYSSDLSASLKLALEKAKGGDKQPFKNVTKIDTTVYLRDIVRGMDWPEENKRLVKEMMVKIQLSFLDHDDPQFKFSVISSFGKLEDLNSMTALIKDTAFAPVIERAFTVIPTIDEKDMKDFGDMIPFLFRSMYKTNYQQGRIECSLDSNSMMYKELALGKPGMRESIEQTPEHEDLQMMKNCTFSSTITLPVAPKEIKSATAVKGTSDKQIVLKGNMLEMLKDPQQYEYSIIY
jgi:hypothetical protein